MKEVATRNKVHNYLILIVLFSVCIGFIIYLCELYKVNYEEKKKTPVISGYLMEIYNEDLEHYLLDNPASVIYICAANDEKCRTFERDLKKLLRKKDYENDIIYLNITDTNKENFMNTFNSKYSLKVKLSSFPAFVLFEDGKIKSIIQGNEKKDLTITKVKQFLELNEIGE